MHGVPYFPTASDTARQGFVRIVNRGDTPGTVSITAIDDASGRAGPVSLSIAAGETVHFNSDDLEGGNPGKGLGTGVGQGVGDWRLELDSELDLEVLAYLRTSDGFLTSMHDVVPADAGRHRVPLFNPGSNANQVSLLRLTNPGDGPTTVRIVGIDDAGVRSEATTSVAAGASTMLTAQELERLGLGDGAGKWQLQIEPDRTILVMSLLRSPTGHLTNLSTAPTNVDVSGDGVVHGVPLMPAAGGEAQGFVRVINHAREAGTVSIRAVDDLGVRRGTLRLALDGGQTAHFNSDDLVRGNQAKGLTGSVSAGTGDWRLELESDLAITVLAYARSRDGFLTSLHDVAPVAGRDHHVAVFNPGRNRNQVSSLRLVNPGDTAAEVTIIAVDDAGETSGGQATAMVPAGGAVTYTVQDLENGTTGLIGSIGAGDGKWRLRVTSRQPVRVLGLMTSATGHLTNLSTSPLPPEVRMVPVTAYVEVHAAVHSVSAGDITVATLGAESAEVATDGSSSLLIGTDDDGTVMLAIADEDGGHLDEGGGAVDIGIESTALTLVAAASGRRLNGIDRTLSAAIRGHGDFGRLTRLLTGLMAADKNYLDRLYDYPQAVTLIKSVAASVASVGVSVAAAPRNEAGPPIKATKKGNFYCIWGSGVVGLLPCSPWDEHEPWHWYGEAEGLRAFFPGNFLEVARNLVIPGYSLGAGYIELAVQSAADTPFMAVSENARNGCSRWNPFCDEHGLHAIANPNYVNYAIELYKNDDYRGWYYTPRNSSVIDKLLNSGAAYRPLRAGEKMDPDRDVDAMERAGKVHLSPDIDTVRFQRYQFRLLSADRAGVVSWMNTFHLVIVGVGLVSDLSEVRKALDTPAVAACVKDAGASLAQAVPDLIADGRLMLDANPGRAPSDLLYDVFNTVAPTFLQAVNNRECRRWLATKGLNTVAKQLARAYADTALLATPVGWAKLLFDAANEVVPTAVSYFAPGAGRVDYRLTWATPGNRPPYISAVSEIRPPEAQFAYEQRDGFNVEVDASGTRPGDSTALTFDWSVDGAWVGRGERLTHDFGAVGNYLVDLDVLDGNGLTGEFSSRVGVTAGSPPVVTNLLCVPTSERTFRMIAAFSDADADIATVEWRSSAASAKPDRTTGVDTRDVELRAAGGQAWASVSVVDSQSNRAKKVCVVDFERDPSTWFTGFLAQRVITTAADGPHEVHAADLDGDGDMDVLSASDDDDKIAWYANDGFGGFSAQRVITTAANGAHSVRAADLDGDGDLDVLSGSRHDDKVAWYANDGIGRFSAQQVITRNADGAHSVHAADLDGDGDVDALSASYNDRKIAWYRNDSTGEFSAQQVITRSANGAGSVHAADLDGDSDLDVLSASWHDNKIAWYRNDGAGGFSTQQVITRSANGTHSVHAADLDGDGDMDVLSASLDDDKIAWYRNDGVGGFSAQLVITTDADGASSVHAADLDGDGDMDVLSASLDDDKVAWHRNDGNGVFSEQRVITRDADGAASVHAADLDGDGDMDVLSASFYGDEIAWYENVLSP